MRGDRPFAEANIHQTEWFTPHARGSTEAGLDLSYGKIVYPACAGIDLSSKFPPARLFSLPRMRGDRPCSAEYLHSGVKFTRMRGIDRQNHLFNTPTLFTPHARIDLAVGARLLHQLVYPHARIDPGAVDTYYC